MGNVSITNPVSRNAYMLGVEWLYETHSPTGIKIFPSFSNLYENHPLNYFKDGKTPPQDGVVEVEIRLVRHFPAEECLETVR